MNLIEKLCKEIETRKKLKNNDDEYCNIDEYDHINLTSIEKILKKNTKPTCKPKNGDLYYIPRIHVAGGVKYNYSYWRNDSIDKKRYENGIAFKRSQEAIDCASDIIKILKEGQRKANQYDL